jgi:hypothetical protein
MTRYLLLLIALLPIATVALAEEQQTPRGIVMAYECKQIDPKVTGFSCEFSQGELRLQWHEKQSEMSPERHDLSKYEFNKIALRYFEFGGMTFPVHADFWQASQQRTCGRSPRKPWYVFTCWDNAPKK